MKAIILAAGRGSRMAHSTENIPKCLLELNGVTLLEWQIRAMNNAGIENRDIVIVTGYKAEQIKWNGVKIVHNENWEQTNMFMSLCKAENYLLFEDCIVSYSDIIYDSTCIEIIKNSNEDIVMPYYTRFNELWTKRFENPLDDIESFKIHEGIITEIGKKPTSMADIEGQYMGIIKFTPKGWSAVLEALTVPCSKPLFKLDMTTLLNHLIEFGKNIIGIPFSGMWLECDNESDLELYEKEEMYK